MTVHSASIANSSVSVAGDSSATLSLECASITVPQAGWEISVIKLNHQHNH